MKTTDFSFDLPDDLIAQHPSDKRGESRLMVLDRASGDVSHHMVSELPDLLPPDTVMVFNDSRVRKARLYGRRLDAGNRASDFMGSTPDATDRTTGVTGTVPGPSPALERGAEPGNGDREFLLVRERGGDPPAWEAMTRKPGRYRDGERILFPGERIARVTGHEGMFVHLAFDQPLDEAYFLAHGHVPLPPYIEREDANEDETRYQTVYAKEPGSVAAPTAGLHFTDELLDRLRDRGVELAWVRLHVGIGTFVPVRVENIEDHTMHEEECELTEESAVRLNEARQRGKRLLAVGTTSVRTLESAWSHERGRLEAFRGPTDLYITPGYEFGAVDHLFTNFHTPHSTLLMLVSAFAGRETILDAYAKAVKNRYRFFSYGDAMLML